MQGSPLAWARANNNTQHFVFERRATSGWRRDGARKPAPTTSSTVALNRGEKAFVERTDNGFTSRPHGAGRTGKIVARNVKSGQEFDRRAAQIRSSQPTKQVHDLHDSAAKPDAEHRLRRIVTRRRPPHGSRRTRRRWSAGDRNGLRRRRPGRRQGRHRRSHADFEETTEARRCGSRTRRAAPAGAGRGNGRRSSAAAPAAAEPAARLPRLRPTPKDEDAGTEISSFAICGATRNADRRK